MYLLIIVLNDPKNINKVLKKFVEIDIRGATIIDSKGMGRILSSEVPVFTSLRRFLSLEENQVENNTIFSVIRTEETLNKAISEINKIINFEKSGTGIMFVLPVIALYGLAPAIPNEKE